MPLDPILGAPILEEGQASAEIDLNETFGRLFAGTIAVVELLRNTPPVSPTNYQAWIVGTAPTGAWAGQAEKIAIWLDGWKFMTAVGGMSCFVLVGQKWVRFQPNDTSSYKWHTLENYAILTDAATVAWDLSRAQTGLLTITANRTIGAPTNGVDGRRYLLSAGVISAGLTLSWASAYKWENGVPVPLSNGFPGAGGMYEFLYITGAMYFLNYRENHA